MSKNLLDDFLQSKETTSESGHKTSETLIKAIKENVIPKKRIVSIDIGIKNLAYCIMSKCDEPKDGNEYEIHDWKVINLLEEDYGGCEGIIKSGKNKGNKCGKQSKIKTEDDEYYCTVHNPDKEKYKPRVPKKTTNIDLQSLCIKIHETLESNRKLFDNVEEVIIEQQIKKSPKNIQVSHLVYSFFIICGVLNEDSPIKKVRFVSSSNKLKVYEGPALTCHLKDKKAQRKWLACRHCEYIIRNDEKWIEYLESLPRKKDDLSDCFLQGAWYLLNNGKRAHKYRKRTTRGNNTKSRVKKRK